MRCSVVGGADRDVGVAGAVGAYLAEADASFGDLVELGQVEGEQPALPVITGFREESVAGLDDGDAVGHALREEVGAAVVGVEVGAVEGAGVRQVSASADVVVVGELTVLVALRRGG